MECLHTLNTALYQYLDQETHQHPRKASHLLALQRWLLSYLQTVVCCACSCTSCYKCCSVFFSFDILSLCSAECHYRSLLWLRIIPYVPQDWLFFLICKPGVALYLLIHVFGWVCASMSYQENSGHVTLAYGLLSSWKIKWNLALLMSKGWINLNLSKPVSFSFFPQQTHCHEQTSLSCEKHQNSIAEHLVLSLT